MKNIIILDMTRIMLKSKRLSKEFWANAIACAVYLVNQSPTRSVWGKITQEVWSKMKHAISHFKSFESIAHVHVHVHDKIRCKLYDEQEVHFH